MEEIDLKELFEIFWSKKIVIAIVVIVFAAIGMIYSFLLVVPKYTSSTTLVLTKAENATATSEINTAITTTDVNLNSQLVSTYSELAKSKKILRAVISNLKIDIDEAELRKSISVTSVKDTEFIEIKVTNTDPMLASQIANEIANVFTVNVAEIYSINNVHLVDQAEPANAPSNINHLKDLVIFAFLGLVVSGGYILVVNMLDTTIKSSEEVEKITKLTILATIPKYEDDGKKKGGIF